MFVEKLAPGVTGKIQVGAEPGGSAQVSVPACGVPLAAGTAPNAPEVEETDPLGAALLQAARPIAATTAHDASAVTRRRALTGDPAALRPARTFGVAVSRGWFIAATFRRDQFMPRALSVASALAGGLARAY